MICYKDQTYCDSDCTNETCFRYLSDVEEKNAGKCGLLIAFCDYSRECDEYEGGRIYDGRQKPQS